MTRTSHTNPLMEETRTAIAWPGSEPNVLRQMDAWANQWAADHPLNLPAGAELNAHVLDHWSTDDQVVLDYCDCLHHRYERCEIGTGSEMRELRS